MLTHPATNSTGAMVMIGGDLIAMGSKATIASYVDDLATATASNTAISHQAVHMFVSRLCGGSVESNTIRANAEP